MHHYDTTLKDILFQWPTTLVEAIAGRGVKRWTNVELPLVNAPRVDLLGVLDDDSLLHLEMQGYDEAELVWHMLMRKAQIRAANEGRSPTQVVVWVGDAPLTLPSQIREPGLDFSVRMVDIREFDAERFLRTGNTGDALLAVLCRMEDRKRTIREILDRISGLPVEQRMPALQRVLILSGLRRWRKEFREEVKRVPVLFDYMEDELFREPYLRGKEEGRQEGKDQGVREGLTKGKAELLARLAEYRFGPLPNWAAVRIREGASTDIDAWSVRVFDAPSLDRIFVP